MNPSTSKLRILLSLAAVSLSFLPLYAQEAADTTATAKELEEVVIEGRTRKAIDHGFMIIPSKKDKKFSTDAYQLLKNIRMPQLSVNDFSVSNSAGQPVALYINYKPCSQFDARVLQTKDVIRVEYLENPEDPRFVGESFVVNFIMKEYAYGGYTTLKADQSFYSTLGSYLLGSKFTYKKTDMSLYAGDNFINDHRTGTEKTETFKGINYDGIHFDEITRRSDSHMQNKWNTAYATFKITNYLKGYNYLQHSLSFNEMRSPMLTGHGSALYSPSITDTDATVTRSDSRRLVPSLRGNYYFLSGMNTFNVEWTARYMNDRNRSNFRQGDFADITTDTDEKAFQGNLNFDYGYYFGKNVIEAGLSTDLARYKTEYSGNTVSSQKLFRSSSDVKIGYSRSFTQSMRMGLKGGANLLTSKVNDLGTATAWAPYFQVYFGWSLNKNHRLSAYATYMLTRPAPARFADIAIQKDPLIWQKGNPRIGNSHNVVGSITYTWIPCDRFNLTLTPMLSVNTNEQTSLWSVNQETGNGNGVCQTFYNADYSDRFQMNASLTWSPFNILQISGNLKYIHRWMKGISTERFNSIEGDIQASVFVKNVMLSASLISPYKQYSFGFRESGYWQYGLSAMYSKGNLSASLSLYNLFLNNRYNKLEYVSPHYSYEEWQINSRSSISVSLSYTISYGKKVQKEGMFVNIDEIDSAVLKGER